MGRPATKENTIAQVAKRRKERLTPKQTLFLKNLHNALAENKGIEGITYGKILEQSGYSKSIQENPQVVLEAAAVKPQLQKIVNRMVEVRNDIVDHITPAKLESAKVGELAVAFDKFQKNINLLVGEATANNKQISIKLDLTGE